MHVHLSHNDGYDLRVATCGMSEALEPVIDWTGYLARLVCPDEEEPHLCPACTGNIETAVALLSR